MFCVHKKKVEKNDEIFTLLTFIYHAFMSYVA